jgi:non-ribosomal peptide synthetase component F
MFHDVGVKYVIITEQNDQLLEGFSYIALPYRKSNKLNHDLDIPAIQSGLNSQHRTHILFTSGSTGKPKPVQIMARNIMHLASKTPFTPLLTNDKVAHFNNPGFDLSLFEIWVTLLSGATIVPIKKAMVTDPSHLKGFLESRDVTVMMLSVALMEVLVRRAFYLSRLATCHECWGRCQRQSNARDVQATEVSLEHIRPHGVYHTCYCHAGNRARIETRPDQHRPSGRQHVNLPIGP